MLYPQPEIGWDMSTVHEFHNGRFRIHGSDYCSRVHQACPVHRPSNHIMVNWPLECAGPGRRPFMTRLCPHGLAHPDPDSLRQWHAVSSCNEIACTHADHFCDGCCHPYIPVDEILADLIAIAEAISGNQ